MTNISPYECVPSHEGEAKCPECGENHKQYGILPEKSLLEESLESLLEFESIDGAVPVCMIHGEDENGLYAKIIPQLVIREGTTLRLLWNDPTVETNSWVQLETVKVDDEPMRWMQAWAGDLHLIAQAIGSFGECEIVETSAKPELDRLSRYFSRQKEDA